MDDLFSKINKALNSLILINKDKDFLSNLINNIHDAFHKGEDMDISQLELKVNNLEDLLNKTILKIDNHITESTQLFKDIVGDITNLSKKDTEKDSLIGDINTTIDGINDRVNGIGNNVVDLSGSISTIQGGVTIITDKYDKVNERLDKAEVDINNVTSKYDNTNNKLTILEDNVGTIQGGIDNFNDRITTIEVSNTSIIGRLDNADNNIFITNDAINEIKTTIGSINSTIENTVVDKLKDESIIGDIKEDIKNDTIDKVDTVIDGKIDNLETTIIGSVNDRIDTTLDGKIDIKLENINTTVSTIQTSNNKLVADISDIKKWRDTTDTAINNNKNGITTINGNIDLINENIDNVGIRIDNVDNKINTTKTDLNTKIETVGGRVAITENTLNEIDNKIETTVIDKFTDESVIGSIKEDIAADAIVKVNEAVDGKIEGIVGDITTSVNSNVDNKIDTVVGDKLKPVSNRLTTVEQWQTNNNANVIGISDINNKVVTIETNVTNLSNNVGTITNTIAGHTTSINSINNKVDNKDTGLVATNTKLTTAVNNIATISDNIDVLTNNLTTTNETLGTINNAVFSETSGLSKLNDKINNVNNKVVEANTSIENINGQITDISTDVMNIATWKNDTADVELEKINGINNNVIRIDTKVDDVKDDNSMLVARVNLTRSVMPIINDAGSSTILHTSGNTTNYFKLDSAYKNDTNVGKYIYYDAIQCVIRKRIYASRTIYDAIPVNNVFNLWISNSDEVIDKYFIYAKVYYRDNYTELRYNPTNVVPAANDNVLSTFTGCITTMSTLFIYIHGTDRNVNNAYSCKDWSYIFTGGYYQELNEDKGYYIMSLGELNITNSPTPKKTN